MRNTVKRIRPLKLVWLLVFAIAIVLQPAAAQSNSEIRNIIYMIGDGMGPLQLATARLAKGAPLVMDGMPVQSRVRNASLNSAVTDSAAAGTAHATGFRTNNGVIAQTPDGQPLDSVVRIAKRNGMATGVVTTDAIHGATPGTYLANTKSRDDKNNILLQAIFSTQPDVLLGGGLTVFNQTKAGDRLNETNYHLVQNRDQLLAWDPKSTDDLLGLFAGSTMSYEVDRPATEPNLAEMVRVALQTLANRDGGFFLMVEGARIDSAGHANDLRRSVYETLAFDDAIAVALAFAGQRTDTLVVVTADHETGGLTQGASSPSVAVLREGPEAIRTKISNALSQTPEADLAVLLQQYAGITDLQPGVFQGNLAGFIEYLLKQGSYYYTTTGHSDTPIPVLAQGPGAEMFLQAEHIADMGQDIVEIVSRSRGGDRP